MKRFALLVACLLVTLMDLDAASVPGKKSGKPAIYKKGWIDFNKNGRKDGLSNIDEHLNEEEY